MEELQAQAGFRGKVRSNPTISRSSVLSSAPLYISHRIHEGMHSRVLQIFLVLLTSGFWQGVAGESIGSGETNLPDHMKLETCFECHFDARDLAQNPSGDIVVHFGATNQPPGVSGGNMVCVDCHYTLATAKAFQQHTERSTDEGPVVPTIQCVDCHGTVEAAPTALFQSKAGDTTTSRSKGEEQQQASDRALWMKHIYRQGEDLMLRSHTGREISITILNRRFRENKWSSELARAVKSQSFHQNMECMDCHVDWAPACLGCHE